MSAAAHFCVATFAYDWYVRNRDRVLSTCGASAHRSAVSQGALGLLRRLL